jgi:hypothetical protein
MTSVKSKLPNHASSRYDPKEPIADNRRATPRDLSAQVSIVKELTNAYCGRVAQTVIG